MVSRAVRQIQCVYMLHKVLRRVTAELSAPHVLNEVLRVLLGPSTGRATFALVAELCFLPVTPNVIRACTVLRVHGLHVMTLKCDTPAA